MSGSCGITLRNKFKKLLYRAARDITFSDCDTADIGYLLKLLRWQNLTRLNDYTYTGSFLNTYALGLARQYWPLTLKDFMRKTSDKKLRRFFLSELIFKCESKMYK